MNRNSCKIIENKNKYQKQFRVWISKWILSKYESVCKATDSSKRFKKPFFILTNIIPLNSWYKYFQTIVFIGNNYYKNLWKFSKFLYTFNFNRDMMRLMIKTFQHAHWVVVLTQIDYYYIIKIKHWIICHIDCSCFKILMLWCFVTDYILFVFRLNYTWNQCFETSRLWKIKTKLMLCLAISIVDLLKQYPL